MSEFARPVGLGKSIVSSGDQVGDAVLLQQHYGQVRNVIQIPFDSSIDGTHPLECFFQMPVNTVRIAKAFVWVSRASFRQYVSASSSSSNAAPHAHPITQFNTPQTTTDGGTLSTSTDSPTSGNQGTLHTHVTSGVTSGTESTNHTHFVTHFHTMTINHSHTYNQPFATDNDSPAHNHIITTTLTPGIFETASTANFSLDVSDNGTPTYVNVVGLSAPPLRKIDVTSFLTPASGDKYLRVNANGLGYCRVLLMLDIVVSAAPGIS